MYKRQCLHTWPIKTLKTYIAVRDNDICKKNVISYKSTLNVDYFTNIC